MKDCLGCKKNFNGRCVSHSKTGVIFPKFYDAVVEEIGFDDDSISGLVDIYGVPCLYIMDCNDYVDGFPSNAYHINVLHPDCYTNLIDRFNQGELLRK